MYPDLKKLSEIHRRFDGAVPRELMADPARAAFYHVCSEGVSQQMWRGLPGQPGGFAVLVQECADGVP